MDKLRAIEYFVRVVEAGSFAAAARELEVSPPAVTHLIAALERELGVPLLRRGPRHLSLTPDGEQFLPACTTALEELRAGQARLAAHRTRASGKLVVGTQKAFGHFVAPFLATHPELTLDLRYVQNPKDPLAALVDVMVFVGWIDDIRMVAKRAGQTRYVTCASPAYWKARGVPRNPDELREHDCLALRSSWGAVLDVWKYQRDGATRTVELEPRMVCDDMDWMIEAAVRGAGVVRLIDLKTWPFLHQGLLDPVLAEWEGLEAPPIHVLYRRGARPSVRVRAFVEFVNELCADLQAQPLGSGSKGFAPVPMPRWFRSNWVGSLTRRAARPQATSGTRG
ncbi:MAG TPA: LysR family transcriptional regulator [Burkholderiaceae bacterium]|nr:LysR family transcriptional regulator [Burkholderiaceae bacterium]